MPTVHTHAVSLGERRIIGQGMKIAHVSELQALERAEDLSQSIYELDTAVKNVDRTFSASEVKAMIEKIGDQVELNLSNALEGFRNNEKLLSGLVHGLPSDVSFTPKYFMPADATAPPEFRQYTDYTPFVKDFVGWLNVADTLPDPSAYAGTNFQSITDGDVEIVA